MRYFFYLILLLSPFCALSQSNYHKGAITTTDGQTISGFINCREWDRNPQSIEFKSSLQDKRPTSYSPTAVKFFVIDGFEKYVTYSGRITMNPITIPGLLTNIDTTTLDGSFFLKLVSKGDSLSLYTYVDSIKTRYFVQEDKQQPNELFFQQYYDETGTGIRTSNRYMGQLSVLVNRYAKGNSRIIRKVEKANYDGAIIDIVDDINGNKKTGKAQQSYTRLYLGLAINSSSTSFEGSSDFGKADKTNFSPRLSFGIDMFNNPNVQRFILRTDVSISYIAPKFTSSYSSTSLFPVYPIYHFNQYNLTIAPQFICNLYNKDDFKFYVDLGVGFNISKYTNNKPEASSGSFPEYEQRAFWVNFPVQLGFVINKRFDLFFAYTGATNYTNYVYISIGTHTYSTGVHYLFGKAGK